MATSHQALGTKQVELPPGTGSALTFLVGALAFGVLAYLSIDLTRESGRIAVVWLPNALAVAYILCAHPKFEKALLSGCFSGNFLANIGVGDPAITALLLSLANIAEIWIAITLTRRWCGPTINVSETGDLIRFMLAAGVVAPLSSACIANLAMADGADGVGPFVAGALRWAASDGLSMLIIAPSVMVFWDAWRYRRRPTRAEALDWIVLTTFGTTLTFFVFTQSSFPLLFLIPPVVVAHAFRLGSLGTAFSVIKVAVIALVCTSNGTGPINLSPVPSDIKLFVLEAFLASSLIVGLPVAAVLSTRERMSRELALGRQQLSLLAENITDAILRYDLDGRCTYASPSTMAVLGAPPADFVGTLTADRAHPESREIISATQQRLLTGGSESERFTYRRLLDDGDGKPVYIEADCAIAYDRATGAREGIIVSARDVTRRVELERQLKRAMRHAENAARAKAQFLANMSHEIRTPMNGVLGFAELLGQMDLPGDAARYAGLIERSGRSMMMLLNDILDISKIESGQLVLSLEEFDLRQLAEDCVRLHKASADRKGIRLRLVCADDLPRRVGSDPLRLRQILLNLIANAVKFTEQGLVEVTVRREDDRLVFCVEDSGIGISPSRLVQIFDPFIQEEASTTRRFGGTGLGLSISRQLAELLGGSLVVDSMPGVGSRFTLRIPLELGADGKADSASSGTGFASEPPGNARILLAEDHDVNRMLALAMLEQLGQKVTVAHDGLEAVSLALEAAEGEEPFDLVLMDIQMPGCDGYSAARMIRRGGVGSTRLPIVALTANAYPEDVAAAHEAGMQDHLAKPLVFDELAAILARWLPVKIVEENRPPPAAEPALSRHSPEILERWAERRSEALEAVTLALREDRFEGVRVERLARTVHKLAGTAGMFGEEELGRKAAALERALRAGVEKDVRKRLAEELLEAA